MDEAILAAVVFNKRASMCAPVVLNREPNVGVVEIWTAKKPT